MTTLTALLALLALPQAAPEADDPWETHAYNVESLLRVVWDNPGVSLGYAYYGERSGFVGDADTGLLGFSLDGDGLVRLIRNNVSEDSWQHEQSKLAVGENMLIVKNRRSVHKAVGQYLDYLRGRARMIVVDAMIVSIDPALLEKVRAASPPERPLALAPEQMRQILDAAAEGTSAEVLRRLRVTAYPGQRANAAQLVRQSVARDYDVQAATGVASFDPIIDHVATGATMDVRPYLEPFGPAVTMELSIEMAGLESLGLTEVRLGREINVNTLVVGGDDKPAERPRARDPILQAPWECKMHCPKMAVNRIRTTLTARDGETVIVGTVYEKGRQWTVLVTPSIVALEDRPAPEPAFDEQRLLRMYDLGPLVRALNDFRGPSLVPRIPYETGAMACAMMVVDEPVGMLYTPEHVISLIRGLIAPETWGNKRNTIVAMGPTLSIRQKPEVLKEIDAYLSSLLSLRAQTVTTEAILVGFRKDARAEWEKEIPALAGGADSVPEAAMRKLLDEAHKGGSVRFLEQAEVTGFPQQRVYAARLQEEHYIGDYETQVSFMVAAGDPVVEVLTSGFVLDSRPHFIAGTDPIEIDLKCSAGTGGTEPLDAFNGRQGPLQLARLDATAWDTEIVCRKGGFVVAGTEERGRGEDREDRVLFLRARPNLLK